MGGRAVLGWPSSSSSSYSSLSPLFGFVRNLHYRYKRPLKIFSFDPTEPAEFGEMAKAESSEYWESFKSWKSEHNKRYLGEKEILYRFGIFREDIKYIEDWNRKAEATGSPDACRLGLSPFSDMSWEEQRPRDFPTYGYDSDDYDVEDIIELNRFYAAQAIESDPDDYTSSDKETDLEEESDCKLENALDELQPPNENL